MVINDSYRNGHFSLSQLQTRAWLLQVWVVHWCVFSDNSGPGQLTNFHCLVKIGKIAQTTKERGSGRAPRDGGGLGPPFCNLYVPLKTKTKITIRLTDDWAYIASGLTL